ncbi:YegS/Rv2252/BmrU family lipid kinase [Ignavibacteriales bacterium]
MNSEQLHCLIINPFAGNGRGKKLAVRLKNHPEFTGLEINTPVDLSEAAAFYHKLNRENVHLLLAGGDGTYNSIVNLVEPPYKFKISFIPSGSGNDLARYFKLASKAETELKKAILRDTETKMDVWNTTISFEDGTIEKRKFINTLGVGFDAYVGTIKEKKKFLTGIAVYVVSLCQALFSYESVKYQFKSDDNLKYSGDAMFITTGNGIYSGGGFKLTPNARVNDGILEICIVDNLSMAKIFRHLPKAITGSHVSIKETTVFNTSSYTMLLDKPAFIHLDGETYSKKATSVSVELSPHKLRISI